MNRRTFLGASAALLAACGKPAILIPLPTAIYDHQMKNAKIMQDAGAAIVIPQAQLNGQRLAQELAAILGNAGTLRAMSAASLSLKRIDAA